MAFDVLRYRRAAHVENRRVLFFFGVSVEVQVVHKPNEQNMTLYDCMTWSGVVRRAL